jgi:myo-inositol 2-dehydrogenase/D-chiro-inositol 1-dehydrogenase
MGAEHARILHGSISGATVTAVADPATDRAHAVAVETGAWPFSSADELIASPFVDAVLIASHDSVHADQVAACLEHRKPVLCEKPLAPTVQECQALIDHQNAIAGNGNPLISVGFMRRFHPAYRELKARLAEGDIGRPLMILNSHRNVKSYPDGNSAATITNSGIHDIDITAWLLDSPVESVSWHAPRSTALDTTRQDPQLLHLRTADGVLTTVDVFLNARYGYEVRCEILGEQGSIALAAPQLTTANRARTATRTYAADWRPVFADAYRLQSQAWIDALTAQTRSPLATAEEALSAARVAQALVRSMNQGGTTVHINDHDSAPRESSTGADQERTPTHVH